MTHFRVSKTTINLGASGALERLDELLCLLGTRHCIGGTIFCRFPTLIGCCDPVASNPVGGPTRGCLNQSIITDCGKLSRLTTLTTDGCGINFSTCPAGSRWNFDDLIMTVDVLEEFQVELSEAAAELEQRLPELHDAFEPGAMDELAQAEDELETALERVRELRQRGGKEKPTRGKSRKK